MSERKCKRCERIDFGIWGPFGLLGYSMVIGAFAYAFSLVYFVEWLPLILIIFGIIFWLPMFFISIHEEKENKE